jgi:hypothetical protein
LQSVQAVVPIHLLRVFIQPDFIGTGTDLERRQELRIVHLMERRQSDLATGKDDVMQLTAQNRV